MAEQREQKDDAGRRSKPEPPSDGKREGLRQADSTKHRSERDQINQAPETTRENDVGAPPGGELVRSGPARGID